jgi:hypothetical protein
MKQLPSFKCWFITLLFTSSLLADSMHREISFQINSFTGIDYVLESKFEAPIPLGFQTLLGFDSHRIGMFMNLPAEVSFGVDNPSYLIDYYYSPFFNKNAEIGFGISTGYIHVSESDYANSPALQRKSRFGGIVFGPAIEGSAGYHSLRFTITTRYLLSNSNIIQIGAGIGLVLPL